MKTVLIVVPLFRFVVLYLLLLGAALICESDATVWRMLLGSCIGCAYTWLSLLQVADFLGNTFVYYFVLLIVGFAVFGFRIRLWIAFMFLNFILDGIVRNSYDVMSIILGTIGLIGLLCMKNRKCNGALLPVCLRHGGKTISFYALHDTGNTLKDPLTGQSVLVVNAKIARELTGLKQHQIEDPLHSLGAIPGLRLIPYRTVGLKSGFMLALRIKEVKIGRQKSSRVVAFAPEGLEEAGEYQALAGGCL